MIGDQRAKAERLRALHAGPDVLVLPNAWDVASARVFAALPGCRAIATTSAGVAAALGYPDGEAVPLGSMLEAVERIALAVALPVTADLEAGYGDSPEAAAATAAEAIAAGAVGLNL
jgi:2-methylisocitrate lyase-like PEP mutase family enzyme